MAAKSLSVATTPALHLRRVSIAHRGELDIPDDIDVGDQLRVDSVASRNRKDAHVALDLPERVRLVRDVRRRVVVPLVEVDRREREHEREEAS
jgi:hypothetical protein